VLLAAFLIFNFGMPVYFYLCPMMNDGMAMCDMSPAPSAGKVSLTSITPDCCARVFVADRKTTPFVKSAEEITPVSQVVAVLPADEFQIRTQCSSKPEAPLSSAESPPPLFLLHSTFLI
jgi:hypothetical protein